MFREAAIGVFAEQAVLRVLELQVLHSGKVGIRACTDLSGFALFCDYRSSAPGDSSPLGHTPDIIEHRGFGTFTLYGFLGPAMD